MSNPYDDLFEENTDDKELSSHEIIPPEPEDPLIEAEDQLTTPPEKEALDEILDSILQFNTQADSFSKLLTKLNAQEHKVESNLSQFFIVQKGTHHQGSLAAEKKYHALLTSKFNQIITPMLELANLHLGTIKRFSQDIDENYYSVDKSDSKVKINKKQALDGIVLQRKVLADAADSLAVLEYAMVVTERRLSSYNNTGEAENLSVAEYEILVQKRTQLTSGVIHQFDYSFFDVNLIDKTAISLGIYMKETSSQYLTKLLHVFEAR